MFDSPKSIEPLERRALFSALHINAGGDALIDARGRAFAADTGFAGGDVATVAPYQVQRPTNDALFCSRRQGASFSFAHAVANGRYSLFLEFAGNATTAAAQHVFDVAVEGAQRISNYDIFATVGAGSADARCVDVNITDGELNLSFTADVGLASVSAIVLVPIDTPATAQPYGWDGLPASQRMASASSNLHAVGMAM